MQGDNNDHLKMLNLPKQVGEFLAWHRQLEQCLYIRNVEQYGSVWLGWHKVLKERAGYQDMLTGGGHAIFLLILAPSAKWGKQYKRL